MCEGGLWLLFFLSFLRSIAHDLFEIILTSFSFLLRLLDFHMKTEQMAKENRVAENLLKFNAPFENMQQKYKRISIK